MALDDITSSIENNLRGKNLGAKEAKKAYQPKILRDYLWGNLY